MYYLERGWHDFFLQRERERCCKPTYIHIRIAINIIFYNCNRITRDSYGVLSIVLFLYLWKRCANVLFICIIISPAAVLHCTRTRKKKKIHVFSNTPPPLLIYISLLLLLHILIVSYWRVKIIFPSHIPPPSPGIQCVCLLGSV